MTNPDDLERAVERVARWANYEWTTADQIAVKSELSTFTAGDLRLILSANREMRKALEFYADEPAREFPSDGPWGVNSDDFGRVARSALTTQRGDGE